MVNDLREWVLAGSDDVSGVFGLMREFYAEEGLEFSEETIHSALSILLTDGRNGAVYLLREGERDCGYFVGSIGFSLEFGGRFALLDELYVVPALRGSGEGKRALLEFEEWAKEQRVAFARLEVNRHNDKAREIYKKVGYESTGREILSKKL